MAVQCPAEGCDYSGMLDAVEGHVGGKVDDLHDGVVMSEVGESFHEGVHEPLAGVHEALGGYPWWVYVGAGIAVYLVLVAVLDEGPEEGSTEGRDGDEEPAEGGGSETFNPVVIDQ